MKLIELKKSSEREIKSLVFENKKNIVDVAYSKEDIEECELKYPNHIKVYQPTQENIKEIISILSENAKIEEREDRGVFTNSDNDVSTFKIFKMLTDIEFSDVLEDDKETLNAILNNPTLLWLKVNEEVNEICNHIFVKYYNNIREFAKYPEKVQEYLITKQANNILQEANNREALEIERREAELKRELEKLKAEKSKVGNKING